MEAVLSPASQVTVIRGPGPGSARGQLLCADPGFAALFLRRRRHGDPAQQHRALGHQLRQSQGRSASEDAVAAAIWQGYPEGRLEPPFRGDPFAKLGDWRWHYVNS